MTSLNPSLRLALLQKAKGKKNIFQKGFTLVELMVVIVIVGILSAIALPNFLEQQNKAKAIEGTTTLSTVLKAAYADYQQDNSVIDASNAATATITNANKDNFAYTHTAITTEPTETPYQIKVLATGDEDLKGKGSLGGCVDLASGKIKISKTLSTDLDEDTISCPT